VAILTMGLAGVQVLQGFLVQAGSDDDALLHELARSVRRELRAFLDQALGVVHNGRPASVPLSVPGSGELPEPIESVLLRWQVVDGRRVGTLDTIARFVRDLEPMRLVVLGGPGAGKTVLLSQLAIDLIARDPIRMREPVPVLLSLTRWQPSDPGQMRTADLAASLWGWVAASLNTIHGFPRSAAAKLVEANRVLPILDGLDEMDTATSGYAGRPRAQAALTAISHDRDRPVILACRTGDFRAIAPAGAAPGGRGFLMAGAKHVVIQPLDAEAVRRYVRARFPGPAQGVQRRWRPLLAAMDRGEGI
jgi:hypothetical protein